MFSNARSVEMDVPGSLDATLEKGIALATAAPWRIVNIMKNRLSVG